MLPQGILPSNPIWDTLSLLIIFIHFPTSASVVLLLFYISSSSSKVWLTRLLYRLSPNLVGPRLGKPRFLKFSLQLAAEFVIASLIRLSYIGKIAHFVNLFAAATMCATLATEAALPASINATLLLPSILLMYSRLTRSSNSFAVLDADLSPIGLFKFTLSLHIVVLRLCQALDADSALSAQLDKLSSLYEFPAPTQPAQVPTATQISIPAPVSCAQPYEPVRVVHHNVDTFLKYVFGGRGQKPDAVRAQPLWSFWSTVRALQQPNLYAGTSKAVVLHPAYGSEKDYIRSSQNSAKILGSMAPAICLTHIGSTLVAFQVGVSGELGVTVNGVAWLQVAYCIAENENEAEYIIVSGLAPAQTYDVQFLHKVDGHDVLVGDIAVKTAGTSSKAEAVGYYQKKFASPLETLQNSVVTTNQFIALEKMKLKKQRREVSKKVSLIRQEITTLRNRISASSDERQWVKLNGLRQNVEQIEAQVVEIEEQITEKQHTEQEMSEEHAKMKDKYVFEKRNYTNFENEVAAQLQACQANLEKLKTELVGLETKKEKLISKHDKLLAEKEALEAEIECLLEAEAKSILEQRHLRQESNEIELTELRRQNLALQEDINKVEASIVNLQASVRQ